MKYDPREHGAKCAECPFYNKEKFQPVPADIPQAPVGLLIGDAPGREDVECRRPFAGHTGRELDATLSQAELSRNDLVTALAVACRPTEGSGPDDRNRAAKCCRPFVNKQLLGLTEMPKLLMGPQATQVFMPLVKGGVEHMRGFVREKEKAIVTVAPTYAYFSNPYMWGAFDGDIQRFARLIRGTLEPGPEEILTEPTVEDLRKLVDERGPDPIAIDVETAPCDPAKPWTGKDPTRAVLRSVGLGTTRKGLSFMWEDATRNMQLEVKRILEDPSVPKVGQNFYYFDERVLARYGINCSAVEDTRDLRCALSTTSDLSLRHIASLYLDFEPWKETEAEDTK